METLSDDVRSVFYRGLGALYLHELTAAMWHDLEDAGFFSLARETGVAFPPLGDEPAVRCAELEVEYARLFVGPGPHVPPVGSVHRPDDRHAGQLRGSTATEVERVMARHGLVVERPGPLPDHLGVLFEFMGRVVDAGRSAAQQHADADLRRARALQAAFFRDHVHPWADRFLDRVAAAGPDLFYAATVAATRWLVRRERLRLGLLEERG